MKEPSDSAASATRDGPGPRRAVESKARKSQMLASAAFVEGWAHYSEQMMIEAGFEKQDPAVRLGQLAEALIRIARLVVAIRLHAVTETIPMAVIAVSMIEAMSIPLIYPFCS